MNKELLTKFRESPGTMSLEELNHVGKFLNTFIALFSDYSQFQDYEGVTKNFIKKDIDDVSWYIDFVNKQSKE